MPIQRYKPEQIVTMLRQIEVSIANWTRVHYDRSFGCSAFLAVLLALITPFFWAMFAPLAPAAVQVRFTLTTTPGKFLLTWDKQWQFLGRARARWCRLCGK